MKEKTKVRVGELRPSQMIYSYGVGSIVDLPSISVMVLGLEEWDVTKCSPINEPRLLALVQKRLGPQLKSLKSLPNIEERTGVPPLDEDALIGVPVAPFPRWMVCPACRRLSPLSQHMFELKPDPFYQDKNKYIHTHCTVSRKKPPTVFPARFLIACKNGHLEDFPWLFYVHKGSSFCSGPLKLDETGPSGEARDVKVTCEMCGAARGMTEAFGEEAKNNLPACRGRRVHLKDEEANCTEIPRTILIGASNIWFAANIAALSIPTTSDRIEQLVEEHWQEQLEHVTSKEVLEATLKMPPFRKFSTFDVDEIWAAVQRKREGKDTVGSGDLKQPEWEVLIDPQHALRSENFYGTEGVVPQRYKKWINQVVLLHRLREVQALTGFTRIESPGDLVDTDVKIVPLTAKEPVWVPANEVRGEGIFIRLNDHEIENWYAHNRALAERHAQFADAQRRWRELRKLPPIPAPPGIMRYILLHSLSHALIRQFSIECGYSAASLKERIYSLAPEESGGPMAGILLYTAAPDSEGTLGGLVGLAQHDEFERYLTAALKDAELCVNDPLCAENTPDGRALHGAACHACLLISETSCERGNRLLDRSLLAETVCDNKLKFVK